MRLFITFVVFLCFASCASHSDTKIVSLNPEKKAESHQRKFSKEEIDAIHADIIKRLSAYGEWWSRVYESDSLLYQGIVECVTPVGLVVYVGPVSENVVKTNTMAVSKDGKTHVAYINEPVGSFMKIDSGYIDIFYADFAFVFDKDSLVGVRPQWSGGHSTSEYKNKMSECAAKYGVSILDEVSDEEFNRGEFERFYGNNDVKP